MGRLIYRFKAFKTREEAMAFRKVNGGMLCGEGTSKTNKQEHALALAELGLPAEVYPYSVHWNETSKD